MVELREFAIKCAHAATTVRDEEKCLVTLLFIIAADEGSASRGGFPIDSGQDVAVLVFAKLVEIEGGSGAAAFYDAHLFLPIGHREQSVTHNGFIIWVAAGDGRVADTQGTLPEV